MGSVPCTRTPLLGCFQSPPCHTAQSHGVRGQGMASAQGTPASDRSSVHTGLHHSPPRVIQASPLLKTSLQPHLHWAGVCMSAERTATAARRAKQKPGAALASWSSQGIRSTAWPHTNVTRGSLLQAPCLASRHTQGSSSVPPLSLCPTQSTEVNSQGLEPHPVPRALLATGSPPVPRRRQSAQPSPARQESGG